MNTALLGCVGEQHIYWKYVMYCVIHNYPFPFLGIVFLSDGIAHLGSRFRPLFPLFNSVPVWCSQLYIGIRYERRVGV